MPTGRDRFNFEESVRIMAVVTSIQCGRILLRRFLQALLMAGDAELVHGFFVAGRVAPAVPRWLDDRVRDCLILVTLSASRCVLDILYICVVGMALGAVVVLLMGYIERLHRMKRR